MKAGLALDELIALAGGRLGVHDAACPMCGPERRSPANRVRKVLRVWLADERFASWCCARCGSKGEAHDRGGRAIEPERLRRAREAARQHEQATAAERQRVARFLWRQRQPPLGTAVERYLRDVRNYRGLLSGTLGFLPPQGEHPPAMVAAFGMPYEPEPGRLAIDDKDVMGVHITRLKLDGSGKADGNAKIMIGRCMGWPIVLAPMNDGLGLAIAEGIEDALSIHEATGLGAWAAGAASRLPALAPAIPNYVEAVSIMADADQAGRHFAAELQAALRARRIRAASISLAAA